MSGKHLAYICTKCHTGNFLNVQELFQDLLHVAANRIMRLTLELPANLAFFNRLAILLPITAGVFLSPLPYQNLTPSNSISSN